MSEIKSDRLEMLRSLQRENPEDPFPAYAIALEYRSAGEQKIALEQLLSLMEKFPDYLPAYYPAIALQIESGEPEKAMELARHGISLARAQNKLKTAGEIKSLIELEIDDDL